jgi:CubicO group peptidase (beta-lactamase class C family)
MRIAELLVNEGRFEGEEVVPPGWVRQMLAPSKVSPGFGYQVWIGSAAASGVATAAGGPPAAMSLMSEPYAADDTYLLKGAGKSRLWLVPSLRLSILRVGTSPDSGMDWDDARIPNIIIRGASDFVPKAAKSGPLDLSTLVPNH